MLLGIHKIYPRTPIVRKDQDRFDQYLLGLPIFFAFFEDDSVHVQTKRVQQGFVIVFGEFLLELKDMGILYRGVGLALAIEG